MPRLAWAREVVHLFSDKGKFRRRLSVGRAMPDRLAV